MDNYINEKTGSKYKQLIIEGFQEFIKICSMHNLQYYCCGGTAIGVVRHQGIIPWDDDIDVLMPREDYNRFFELASRNINENFELIDPEKYKNYYLPFAKFSHKNSTVMEHKRIHCIFGANIDIFPLDGAPDNKESLKIHYYNYKRNANRLFAISKSSKENLRSFFDHLWKLQLRNALKNLYYSFNKTKMKEKTWKNINELLNKYPYNNSSVVGNYGGIWGLKEFAPKKWFEEHVFGDFEGFPVKIPKEYDKLLTQLYGDYMTPPPKSEQHTHHHVAYVNLQRRVELKEILESIKEN